MTSQARIGLIVTAIGFFTGIWLFLAPFIVEYQKVGQDWIVATKNDLWTGAPSSPSRPSHSYFSPPSPCATRHAP
jgi:hypothetical protein